MDAIAKLFDHLAYVSYRTQRDLGVSAESCKKMGFPNVDQLEKEYIQRHSLFVTEDGVGIKKGDKYWMVYDDLSFVERDTDYKWAYDYKFKVFSTKDAAGKFIIHCLENDTF